MNPQGYRTEPASTEAGKAKKAAAVNGVVNGVANGVANGTH